MIFPISFLLILITLGGCAGVSKHETISLQCLGFCNFTDVNHEADRVENNSFIQPEKANPSSTTKPKLGESP